MDLNVAHFGKIVEKLEETLSLDKYISSTDYKSLEIYRPTWGAFFLALTGEPHNLPKLFKYNKQIKTLRSEKARVEHNQKFIARSQEKIFEIENNLLDKQQIEAVVACEDAQLVMAAAGSGKTLSLLAKVDYLVNTLKIPQDRILTISFTKKSADELANRLARLGLEVDGKTFHALGKSILGDSHKKVLDQSTQEYLIQDIIDATINNDAKFARRYNDYLLNYFSMPIFLCDIKNMKEMVESNKTFQTRTLKEISLNKSRLAKDYKTTRGEFVRSKEEQIIANFLFINNIEYQYEQSFPGYKSYRPDFTITQFGEPIYIEHQGIDQYGRTRPDIDSKKYQEKIRWNQNFHRDHRTKLIQTYSYEFSDGSVLENLEQNLLKHGAEIVRKQESEILELIQKGYRYDFEAFNKLLITYLNLIKTSNKSLDSLLKYAKTIPNPYKRNRTVRFLEIFSDIFMSYEQELSQTQTIDFSDMIVKATERLKNNEVGGFTYDYILVDEAQDLSVARYNLVKSLLAQNPSCKLFAVGDDWQSIFRFAGSDMSLIYQFDKFFGPAVHHSVIEQTYRFNGEALVVSSSFIKENPDQIQKVPFSNLDRNTTINAEPTTVIGDDAGSVHEILLKLAKEYSPDNLKNQKIFLISRYNQDIDRLENSSFIEIQNRQTGDAIWTYRDYNISLKFMTMHSSKGLTCDHTIILNCNSGKFGIPAEKAHDPVLQLLLSAEDTFPNAEERRLFYVATTRAKLSTSLVFDMENISSFIAEIIDFKPQSFENVKRCPDCETGILKLRNGVYGKFYGCSNFKYGCRFKASAESNTGRHIHHHN